MLILLLLQIIADPPGRWYETPTGAAAILTVLSVMVAPFINNWIQTRKSRLKENNHISDTSLNLNAKERKEILEQMRYNHAHEIKFLRTQLEELGRKSGHQALEMRVSEYEARQRAHAYGNECYRLQTQVSKLQLMLMKADIDPPEFVFLTYPEIMAGIDEKVVRYKEELEDELNKQLKRSVAQLNTEQDR